MSGIARKLIDQLKSKEFREYLMRLVQKHVTYFQNVLSIFFSCLGSQCGENVQYIDNVGQPGTINNFKKFNY